MWRTSGGKGRSIIVATVLAAGCKDPEPPQPPPPHRNAPADIDRASMLLREPVTAERPNRVLYTWTTFEQVEQLRRDRKLLVRESSPTNGASYYEQVIHALAQRGDAVAKLLDTTTFAKSRFAWPAPWATREGWPGETYGDQLIRVTLRQNAIVLSLSTATGALIGRDLDGAFVPQTEVAAHPERIAAVFFESAAHRIAPGLPKTASSYREYVLCNESMIATWSVGTQDIFDELELEARALDALARELRSGTLAAGREHAYFASLAVSAPTYWLDEPTIAGIAAHLRATPRPPAIEGSGGAWPGIGPARTLPVVKQKPSGTYAGSY